MNKKIRVSSKEVETALSKMLDKITKLKAQAKKDRAWLREIIRVYDRTPATVPTEFDSKIVELKKYLKIK